MIHSMPIWQAKKRAIRMASWAKNDGDVFRNDKLDTK